MGKIVHIYGIKNCDTMRKSLKWFENSDIDYSFHDYKKEGVDADVLSQAIEQQGWEQVINMRGTTWKKLPEDIKAEMDAAKAAKIAAENPSLIKRPMILDGNHVILGFDEEFLTTNLK